MAVSSWWPHTLVVKHEHGIRYKSVSGERPERVAYHAPTPPASGEGYPNSIAKRWQRDNPWTWQRKHLAWFLNHHLNQRTESTHYYYLLTVQLLTHRLGKPWQFNS